MCEKREFFNTDLINHEMALQHYCVQKSTKSSFENSYVSKHANNETGVLNKNYFHYDEHASPFCYRTKSQLNLSLIALEEEERVHHQTTFEPNAKDIYNNYNMQEEDRNKKIVESKKSCDAAILEKEQCLNRHSRYFDAKEQQNLNHGFDKNELTRLIRTNDNFNKSEFVSSEESMDVLVTDDAPILENIGLLSNGETYLKKGFEFLNNW